MREKSEARLALLEDSVVTPPKNPLITNPEVALGSAEPEAGSKFIVT